MPREPKIWRRLAQNPVCGLVLLSAALFSGCEAESHPEDAGSMSAADSGRVHAGSSAGSDRDSGPAQEPSRGPSCKDNVPDAPSACHSAPYFLKCEAGKDGIAMCASSKPTQCEESVGETNCHDQCADDEYAVACGGVGPNAPQFSEPPGCRGFGRNPGGGSETFCCPCPAP